MFDLTSNNLVNEDKSIVGALDFISQQITQRQNLTFILTEVTDIQDDTITARHFLDLVTLAEERGATIIVISNNSIWKQLQRLGMSLSLDLPEEDEIYQIIKESIEPYQNSITISLQFARYNVFLHWKNHLFNAIMTKYNQIVVSPSSEIPIGPNDIVITISEE